MGYLTKVHRNFALAGLLVAAAAFPSFALPDRSAIRADAIRQHVTYLASSELQGRGSGTRGNELAGKYIAEQFHRAGLKPLGTSRQSDPGAKPDHTGYFQPFTFTAGVAKGKSNRLEATIDGKRRSYRTVTEFEPSGISGSGSAEGEVVFVGYGIVSKDPAHDDYGKLDVKGKVVLLVAGAPGTDPHSPLMAFAGIRGKAITARDKGAAAVVVVLPKASDAPRMSSDELFSDAGLPIVVVRSSVVKDWLVGPRRMGGDTDTALTQGGPTGELEGVRVKIQTEVRKVTKTTANIAGLLEGTDPSLKSEVVVIGAHMDHLGMGGPHSLSGDKKPAIHHGADDNASGTAGVIALADYFSDPANRPKRSIVFIAFSGEELGLLGSAYYVKNPLVPLDRTVAMLNMDMIGRMTGNKLVVSGSGTSPAWNALLDQVNNTARFTLSRSDSGFGASDQQSFYVAKIPVLFFFTGLHADYHKPSDTADKVNVEDQVRIVGMVADCARRIGDMSERPAYQAVQVAQDAGAARFRVSLGSIPDYASEVEGVQLSGVRPGSPADKAGIKAGDIIVKFGGKSIKNVQEYTVALGDFKPGDVVEIVVKRGNDLVTVKATLEGSRR
jgi:aminopeptidase YwaD